MADINVVCPEDGSNPIATRPDHAVLEQELITWAITSFNQEITKVKLVFDSVNGQKPKFFQKGATRSHQIEKKFRNYRSLPDGTKMAREEVYGTAPNLTKTPNNSCAPYKYDIVGYRASGKPIILDPKIVIAKP